MHAYRIYPYSLLIFNYHANIQANGIQGENHADEETSRGRVDVGADDEVAVSCLS